MIYNVQGTHYGMELVLSCASLS